MSYKLNLKEDEGFVKGRSEELSVKLVEDAKAAGLDPKRIRTTSTGYIVPKELATEGADDTHVVLSHAVTNGAAEANASKTDADESVEVEEFDPAKHSVKDVKAYLETADEAERERVLTAEKEGQARPTLVENDENEEQK